VVQRGVCVISYTRAHAHTHTQESREAMCGVAANLNLRASFHRHESMSPRIHESRMPGAQKVNPSCTSQMKITNTHTYTYSRCPHILTTSLPCLIRSLRVCHSGCLFLIGSSCLPLCLCPSLSLFHPPHLWGRPVHQSTALWPPFSDASAII